MESGLWERRAPGGSLQGCHPWPVEAAASELRGRVKACVLQVGPGWLGDQDQNPRFVGSSTYHSGGLRRGSPGYLGGPLCSDQKLFHKPSWGSDPGCQERGGDKAKTFPA